MTAVFNPLPAVTSAQLRVLWALARAYHHGGPGAEVYPSIMETTGLTRATIHVHLRCLEAAGLAEPYETGVGGRRRWRPTHVLVAEGARSDRPA